MAELNLIFIFNLSTKYVFLLYLLFNLYVSDIYVWLIWYGMIFLIDIWYDMIRYVWLIYDMIWYDISRGVAVDEQGFIFVADSGNNRIQIFNPDGTFLRAFGRWGQSDAEFKGLEGIAVNASGNILVADRENHRIQIF